MSRSPSLCKQTGAYAAFSIGRDRVDTAKDHHYPYGQPIFKGITHMNTYARPCIEITNTRFGTMVVYYFTYLDVYMRVRRVAQLSCNEGIFMQGVNPGGVVD